MFSIICTARPPSGQGPTTPRPDPGRSPFWADRRLVVAQGFGVDQAAKMRRVRAVAVINQLVNVALATPGAMHDQVFHLDQPGQMHLELGVARIHSFAQFARA